MKIRIASRESRLAMWQAEHVKSLLLKLPEVSEVEIVGMTTKGDQILDQSLSKIGGKGLFIKELEAALLAGQADLAVHSGKDIPMALEPEFKLLGFMTREVPTDAFVSNDYASLADLPAGSVVGSSSLRRQAQLLAKYPHLKVHPLRGNLDTRLGKLDRGEYQAIILATAGLKRLGLESRIKANIAPEDMLPAVGQGALGLEVLSGRSDLDFITKALVDPVCTQLVGAERMVSRELGGSCQVPLAGYAILKEGGMMHLRALVATVDGSRVIEAEASAPLKDFEQLAIDVVGKLKAQGAEALLSAGH
jgi:hydroxymethylbilane synthase